MAVYEQLFQRKYDLLRKIVFLSLSKRKNHLSTKRLKFMSVSNRGVLDTSKLYRGCGYLFCKRKKNT